MLIDIDNVLQAAKPWDLRIKLDGSEFAIRRLSNADFKRLVDAENYTEEDNRLFLLGMFSPTDRMSASLWDAERMGAVTGVVVNYYQLSVMRKNAEMLARAVADAMGMKRPAATNGSTD